MKIWPLALDKFCQTIRIQIFVNNSTGHCQTADFHKQRLSLVNWNFLAKFGEWYLNLSKITNIWALLLFRLLLCAPLFFGLLGIFKLTLQLLKSAAFASCLPLFSFSSLGVEMWYQSGKMMILPDTYRIVHSNRI